MQFRRVVELSGESVDPAPELSDSSLTTGREKSPDGKSSANGDSDDEDFSAFTRVKFVHRLKSTSISRLKITRPSTMASYITRSSSADRQPRSSLIASSFIRRSSSHEPSSSLKRGGSAQNWTSSRASNRRKTPRALKQRRFLAPVDEEYEHEGGGASLKDCEWPDRAKGSHNIPISSEASVESLHLDAHSYWKWDTRYKRWYHRDESTGEVRWAPENHC